MITEFAVEDFNKMEFNPFATNEMLMVDKYKKLRRRRAFRARHKLIDLDTLLRFVVVFVDPQSPLSEERDFDERMSKAVKVMEIEEGSNEFLEIYRQPIEELGNYVPGTLLENYIFEYFKMVNNHEFELWFTLKMDYHQQCQYLRSPAPADPVAAGLDATRRNSVASALKEKMMMVLRAEDQLFQDERIKGIVVDNATKDDDLAGYAERYALDNEFFTSNDFVEMYEDED